MKKLNKMEVPPDFNWKLYLELNPDISKYHAYSTQSGAISHWKQYGREEGRQYKGTVKHVDKKIELNKFGLKDFVVYTCISSKYDTLNEILVKEPNVDYICYTDLNINSKTWEIRKIPNYLNELDSVRKARFIKIMPHMFLKEYSRSLWVDGNIEILGKLNNFICNTFDDYDISIPRHPLRNCVYDESVEIIEVKKDDEDIVTNQMLKYIEDGYPKNFGLAQSNVLIRKHNKEEVINFSKQWWREVLHHSRRDQLSFNYVLYKNQNINIGILNPLIIFSEFFKMREHGIDRNKNYVLPHGYGDIINYVNGVVSVDVQLKPVNKLSLDKPIRIYYHIGAIDDDYQSIVDEQLFKLKNSGLLDCADKIYYSIVGKQQVTLPENFECRYKNKKFKVAELPLLEILREDSKKDDFYCLYLHTKGSSRNYLKTPKGVGRIWRNYLDYFNIEQWKKCVTLLDSYDTVGTSLKKSAGWYLDHYSGNFWWANSDYISTLPSVYDVKLKDETKDNRYKAEMWILNDSNSNPFNWMDFYPAPCDEKTFKTPDEYKKTLPL